MNAVIYARYSSHGQTEQSIEGQLHDNYAWAEQQDITVVGEYIDRALTGTKDQRPEFQRMIADAAKKQFQMVIVWKLDRFARNRYDSAIYKARLKKYGVKVVSVKEAISDSPEGIILEGLLESMAEYYSANLSQNVKRGMRETAAKGKWCGGTIPFGYAAKDGKLVVNDKLAPHVRFLFEQYANGLSRKEIIDMLTERGVTGSTGKRFSYNCMAHVLSNTVYIGQYKYDGKVIPGLSERIISDELFERVQQRLKSNARAPGKRKAKIPYLLTGKIWCGHCGAAMAGDAGTSHTGDIHHYYACQNKKKHHACHKKNERKDSIEWYVVEQTLKYILDPAQAAAVAKAVVAEYKNEFSDSRVSDLEKAIAQIDRETEKLVDALIDAPKAAHKRIYDRMESLEAQKADIEADLTRLRIASDIQLTEAQVRAWLRQFAEGDPSDEQFRQRIIDVFINAIFLYDDRIVIFYNIRGGKQVSYTDLLSATIPTSTPPQGSDLTSHGSPTVSKSEPTYIFVNGVFGCVIHRCSDIEQKSVR